MNHTNENIAEYVDLLANKRRSNIHSSASDYDRFDTKSYYVSNSGSDENDGTSPANAWKTLDKANSLASEENCNLLFERGGVWRGSLILNGNVTVSAYGKGEKPLFLGSPESGADKSKWSLVSGTTNVWRFHAELPDCGTVVLDDDVCAKKITPALSDGKLKYELSDLSENLSFISDAYGADGALYLRCDEGNPGEVFSSVEFAAKGDGVTSTADNVTVNNIALKYFGGNGIAAADGVKGYVLYMNELSFIGGAVGGYSDDGKAERYGCGALINGAIERCFVDNCIFDQIYEAAVSHKLDKPALLKKVIFSNNLIERCTYSYDYYHCGNEDGKIIDDLMFMSNICRHVGEGWGMAQHGEDTIPSHVKTWNCAENRSNKMVIKNNIFDGSIGALIFITASDEADLPKMLKNVYIAKEGGLFGAYGKSPKEPETYRDLGQKALSAITREFAAEFYFA